MQLGGVDGVFEGSGPLGGEAGRRRVRQVAHAEAVRLDAVVDAPDPGGPFAQFAGPLSGREDHGCGTVADGRAVTDAQGLYEVFALGHRTPQLRMGVGGGRGTAAGRHTRQRGLVGLARVDERLRLEGREGDGVGPQGREVVRVELPGQDVPYGSG